jgi:hypothetical protein
MKDQDTILLEQEYEKIQSLNEGLFKRLGANLSSVKQTVQSAGQNVMAKGREVMGGQKASADASDPKNRLYNSSDMGNQAKIKSIVASHSQEIVNDLLKLNILPKDADKNDLIFKLKDVISNYIKDPSI